MGADTPEYPERKIPESVHNGLRLTHIGLYIGSLVAGVGWAASELMHASSLIEPLSEATGAAFLVGFFVHVLGKIVEHE